MTVTRFLDPAVLARIDDLELVARTVVEGFINGLHRSPYLGRSMDFAEHRAYMPGDDIRRVDWRVFGRTDRFFVKEFEADTNTNFTVLLDISRSMDYGSGPITKLDYAKYLAACLTWFCRQQRDRVGLVTFDSDIVTQIPPAAKHLDRVLHELDRLEAGGAGELRRPLSRIAESLRRRSLVVLISDFYDEPQVVLSAVGLLRGKGNDVIVFHVLDPAEVDFPFHDLTMFEDLETGEQMPIVPEDLRDRYRALMAEHGGAVARALLENQVDYSLILTSQPLDFALFEFLTRRQRLVRVR